MDLNQIFDWLFGHPFVSVATLTSIVTAGGIYYYFPTRWQRELMRRLNGHWRWYRHEIAGTYKGIPYRFRTHYSKLTVVRYEFSVSAQGRGHFVARAPHGYPWKDALEQNTISLPTDPEAPALTMHSAQPAWAQGFLAESDARRLVAHALPPFANYLEYDGQWITWESNKRPVETLAWLEENVEVMYALSTLLAKTRFTLPDTQSDETHYGRVMERLRGYTLAGLFAALVGLPCIWYYNQPIRWLSLMPVIALLTLVLLGGCGFCLKRFVARRAFSRRYAVNIFLGWLLLIPCISTSTMLAINHVGVTDPAYTLEADVLETAPLVASLGNHIRPYRITVRLAHTGRPFTLWTMDRYLHLALRIRQQGKLALGVQVGRLGIHYVQSIESLTTQ